MALFSSLKRLVGNITLEVTDDLLIFDGLPADVIMRDIGKIMGTSRIERHMFADVQKHGFSIHKFFAIDLVYMLDQILADRAARSSKRTLLRVRELVAEKTNLLSREQYEPEKKLNRSVLSNLKHVPKDFQDGFFDFYEYDKPRLGLSGALLAAAAGSGKTFTSIALAEMSDAEQVIVVCPNQALDRVWRMALDQDSHECLFVKPTTWWVKGFSKDLVRDQRYVVFNYEYLEEALKYAALWSQKKCFVILDESHNLNEFKSMRTDLFIKLCKMLKCQDVLWMSGTPIKALGSEAIPLLQCIDESFTPACMEAFKKIYGMSSQRASEMLNHRLNGLMYVVPKSALKLPEPIMQEFKVKVHNGNQFTLASISHAMTQFIDERTEYYRTRQKQDYAAYDEYVGRYEKTIRSDGERREFKTYRENVAKIREFRGDTRVVKDEMAAANSFEKNRILPVLKGEEKKHFREVKSIYKYVHLKIQGECLGRVVGRARVEAHAAIAGQVNYVELVESAVKKTLVFSTYIDVLKVAAAKVADSGLEAAHVYGPYTKDLAKTVGRFEKEEDLNPLLATYDSLSTAVPLTMANNLLLLDMPWRDYRLQQTISRISRLGADTDTFVHMAVLDTGEEPNISTRGMDILKWSQQSVAAITGVPSPFDLNGELESSSLSVESFCAESAAFPIAESEIDLEDAFQEKLEDISSQDLGLHHTFESW